jgi:hypothetical protein
VTAKDIWDYHVATRCSLERAKALLSGMSPELRERVLVAIKQKRRMALIDPIEADPLLGAAIREAAEEAAHAADLAGHHGKGKCHVIWRMQKKILAERHGIVWFSPQDMNPSAFFD